MNGARFVHDELVTHGWEVLVADAQRVKGLAPLACKTDKIDARVLAELSFRDLVPAIWLPTPELRREREISRWRLHLVKHRTTLKNRIHSTLIALRPPGPDGRPVRGRRAQLLAGLDIPEPWRGHVDASLELIDDLELRIGGDRARAAALGRRAPLCAAADERARVRVDHLVHGRVRDRRHQPVLHPGQADRLYRPVPAREPVRRHDRRGPISKHGPRYLRWGLMEAAIHAAAHPLYRERYQRTKRRLGRQRGAKVAQIDLARKLTEAIWYMLTRNQPFAPAGATVRLAA